MIGKMTHKQKLFCQYYIESLNATQSAIRAGYSEKTAYQTGAENLRKPQIKEYLEEQMTTKENLAIASANEVLEKLTFIMRNSNKNFEVLKACELLGKRYGLWLDNQVPHEKTIVNIINDIP